MKGRGWTMITIIPRIARWKKGAAVLAALLVSAVVMQAAGLLSQEARAGSDGSQVSGNFSFSGRLLFGCPVGAALCTSGTMSGSLSGPFTLTLLTALPSPTLGVYYFNGKLVLHTSGGDLNCDLNGASDFNAASEGEFGEICVVTGGTGVYKTAKGDLRLTGTSTSVLGLIPSGGGSFQGLVTTS
jgi:hypothetical protein